jgi:hypothetical protein
MGQPFLTLYKGIVTERVFAKKKISTLTQQISKLESMLETM